MASKSKDVRIEQLRMFEKKLSLRLEQLGKRGVSKEKLQNDPMVKNLKAKIRQTKVRIAAFDKFVQQAQALTQAKAAKLAAAVEEEKTSVEPASEAKPKAKKKEDGAAPKKVKKQPAEAEEAAPKKAKKQPAEGDDAAPQKKTTKKKEE